MTERVLDEQLDEKLLLNYYKKMLELRLFELKVQELYRNARLPGFVHLYVGEEAVAVGVAVEVAVLVDVAVEVAVLVGVAVAVAV